MVGKGGKDGEKWLFRTGMWREGEVLQSFSEDIPAVLGVVLHIISTLAIDLFLDFFDLVAKGEI